MNPQNNNPMNGGQPGGQNFDGFGGPNISYENYADPQPQRFVAVYGHAGGQKLGRTAGGFGEEIHDLPAVHIDDGDCLSSKTLNKSMGKKFRFI